MLHIAYIALPEFKTKRKDDPPHKKTPNKQKTKTKQKRNKTQRQQQHKNNKQALKWLGLVWKKESQFFNSAVAQTEARNVQLAFLSFDLMFVM